MIPILDLFPKKISQVLYQNIAEDYSNLEEIRIRVDKPIILKFLDKEIIIPFNITR